jgi:hypothetical protein
MTSAAHETFVGFYRCPESLVTPNLLETSAGAPRCSAPGSHPTDPGQFPNLSHSPGEGLLERLHTLIPGLSATLPSLSVAELIGDLRLERYVRREDKKPNGVARDAYYLLRPLLGVSVRKHLQKLYLRAWNRIPFPRWPVDTTVEELLKGLMVSVLHSLEGEPLPFVWFWPDGASACFTMTHDVETQSGIDSCSALMDIDEMWGIKASYQIVPEKRYKVTQRCLDAIRERGFELNIQDLNHDGQLFRDRETFESRAKAINRYARAYGARGFRSAAMYRNADWLEALDISYDLSIPNVAHLEPQRGGCCTVFPYFIGRILEIPLTTTQDYSLFHILDDYSIDLWKRQIGLIRKQHGLVSFIVHPDYILSSSTARSAYGALLGYLAPLVRAGRLWMALPGEIDDWWRARSEMQIVADGSGWAIKGRGSERARLAFASLKDGRLSLAIPRNTTVPCTA